MSYELVWARCHPAQLKGKRQKGQSSSQYQWSIALISCQGWIFGYQLPVKMFNSSLRKNWAFLFGVRTERRRHAGFCTRAHWRTAAGSECSLLNGFVNVDSEFWRRVTLCCRVWGHRGGQLCFHKSSKPVSRGGPRRYFFLKFSQRPSLVFK